jgi:hypothetical protein
MTGVAKKPKKPKKPAPINVGQVTATAGVPISDQAWKWIVAAVAPHKPDGVAREVLDRCLQEYINKAGISLEGLKQERAPWKRVIESINNASNQMIRIRMVSRPLIWGDLDQGDLHLLIWSDQDQQDLLTLRQIHRRIEQKVEAIDVFLRARRGWQDPVREQLFQRLFGIWEKHFSGKVRRSRNKRGDVGGPLVRFITMIFQYVLLEPTSGIPNAIERERRRRRH